MNYQLQMKQILHNINKLIMTMAIALWSGAMVYGSNTTSVNLNDVIIVEGQSSSVYVTIKTTDDVRDVLFDIFLPKEVTLEAMNLANGLTGHELMTNVLESTSQGTTMRFGIVSDEGHVLLTNDSVVLVTLTLTGNVIADTYGRLENVSVSTDHDLTIIQENSSFDIRIVNDAVADSIEYQRISALIEAQKALRDTIAVLPSYTYSQPYLDNYNSAYSNARNTADAFHAAVVSHRNVQQNEANVSALADAVKALDASVKFDMAYNPALASFLAIKVAQANYSSPALALNSIKTMTNTLDGVKAAADKDAVTLSVADNIGSYLEVLSAINWQKFAKNVADEKYGIKELTVDFTVSDNDAAYIRSLDSLLVVYWESLASAIPSDIISANSPNALIYAKDSVESLRDYNVIINNEADSIVFNDRGALRIPKAFKAKHISFSREFSKPTYSLRAAGWESLVLPFDVMKIESEKKGEIVPYGIDKEGVPHFWLAAPGDSVFTYSKSIKANQPYIISMPNDPKYLPMFNITGTVTFSSENLEEGIDVFKTDSLQGSKLGEYTLVPTYEVLAQDEHVFVLNDEKTDQYEAGALFVKDSREVRPFECYILVEEAPARMRYVTVGSLFGEKDGIDVITTDTPSASASRLYNLSGQRISTAPSGTVYIIKGKKVRK